MGHCIEYLSYNIKNKEVIIKSANDYAQRMSDCHSPLYEQIEWYENKIYDTYDDGVAAIEEINCSSEKAYRNIAVKCYNDYEFWGNNENVKKYATAKLRKLQASYIEVRKKYNDLQSTKYYTAENLKTKYKTCSECQSKINMEIYMQRSSRSFCPVCGNDMRPATVVREIEKLKSKVKMLEEKIHAEKASIVQKHKNKVKMIWLLKIEYHV